MAELHQSQHLALALGGGGSLGAAHVGVLQVVQELALPIRIVVGTSAGAIAAAAYAAGLDLYRLEEMLTRASWKDFGRFTFKPGLGLFDTAALAVTAQHIVDQKQNVTEVLIEDLSVKFAAVVTDVKKRETSVISSGPLLEAVRASIAVPGIFRPLRRGNKLFVDGGILQNLPLPAAFELGADHAIGVRLAPEWDPLPAVTSSVAVHEWEIRPDVTLIIPKLGNHRQWEAKDIPALVAAGRDAARAALS